MSHPVNIFFRKVLHDPLRITATTKSVLPSWSASRRVSPRAHLHVVGMLRFVFLTQTDRACPLLFILFLCPFLSTVFHSINSLYYSPRSHFVLPIFFLCLIGPFNYISLMKISFSPDIILCDWLDLKHQLTNWQTLEGLWYLSLRERSWVKMPQWLHCPAYSPSPPPYPTPHPTQCFTPRWMVSRQSLLRLWTSPLL